MNRGILQFCSDLREIQVVFPDHLLALLELDAADVFTGRNLQILVEQSCQIAGAHVYLPGYQRNGQLLPYVGGNVLLSLADNFILGMDRIGGLKLTTLGCCRFPQQEQQQQIQLGQDNLIGEHIHPLLLPEHILKQGHHILGSRKLPVHQRCQLHALQFKRNGHKPGCNTNISILHMPLTGAINHQISLFQQQILTICHRV